MPASEMRVWGNGPCQVVLIAGWLGTSADWEPCLQSLDPKEFSVGLFDLRGYGERKAVRGLFSFEEAAHDLVAMVDQLGWSSFAIVGHSMGAMLMQRVPLIAPGRVQRLVGIAPVPACGARMPPERLVMFASAVHDPAQRSCIVAASTGQRLSPAWCNRVAKRSWERSEPEAVGAYLTEWALNGFEGSLVNMPPVTLFVGEHDPSITHALMETTWRRWYMQSAIETVPNAGHYPMLETPAFIGSRLESLLMIPTE